jgi:hypothetical protein
MVANTPPSPQNDSSELSSTIKLINTQVSRLDKAYIEWMTTDPKKARRNVDMQFSESMRLLRKPVMRNALNAIFTDPSQDPNAIKNFLESPPEKFIKDETQSVRQMRFSKEDIADIHKSVLKRNQNVTIPFSNVDEFYSAFERAHHEALSEIKKSRELGKNKKAKQKRKIAEGCSGIVAGVALCVGNSLGAVTTATTIVLSISCFASIAMGSNRLLNGYSTIVDSGS